jgi:hypothetical protein
MKSTAKQQSKIRYELEADVLSWEITGQPIDYAKEVGNLVVHFTKHNMPVLVEILEASKFLTKVQKVFKLGAVTERKISPAFG